MPSYVKSLYQHLGAYKTSRIGVQEPGNYAHKGRELHYAHILPNDLRWLNILEAFRTELRQYVAAHPGVKLHKYFHHLNSSQAFALNLFFPFFEQGHSAPLLRAMGLKGSVASWQPEHIADENEGTNIDISWQSPTGAWTYCEVKLSEQEFGSAKNDKRHRDKLDTIYRPVLSGHCSAELLGPEAFFANYQLLPVINMLSPLLKKRIHAVAIESGPSVPLFAVVAPHPAHQFVC